MGVTVSDMGNIPWDEVLPLIRQWHDQGEPWTRMADSLNAKFGTAVSPSSVQYWYEQLEDQAGYRIPARRERAEKLSKADIREAIHFANKTLGRRATAPLSIADYDRVRMDRRDVMPSSVGIRRKFGNWTSACEAVGVSTNQPKRSYDGLTPDDAILWLAHWLRDLRREEGLPVASAASYRKWLRSNPTAPSYDALRNLGVWGDLVEEAALVEQGQRRLGRPKGVSSGPSKQEHGLLQIP